MIILYSCLIEWSRGYNRMKKIFLCDGHNLAFRAFFEFVNLMVSDQYDSRLGTLFLAIGG